MAIVMFGCHEKVNVVATIENLEEPVLVRYAPINDPEKGMDPMRDTISSNGRKFKYKLPSNETHLLIITPLIETFQRKDGSYYRPSFNDLYLLVTPDDRIQVTGRINKYFTEYSAKGSKFNEDMTVVRQRYVKEASKAVKIEMEIDSLTYFGGDKELIQEKFKQRNNLFELARKYQLGYIKSSIDSELSAYYILRQPIDTLVKYYNILNPQVRKGQFREVLNYMLNEAEQYVQAKTNQENLKIGSPFRPFALSSLSGEEIVIDSIKTEYLILDFWGSWCGPCIKGFPKMKEYYRKYNGRIEIVGIACNDKVSDWKQAVNTHDLPWINVHNIETSDESNVAILYGIMSFPTKFIINSSGNIIGRFEGENEAFYSKLDSLLMEDANKE
jgi:thiol-disulfide isomerase/thioredoxin